MREVIVGCASAGLFEPRWSDRILEEWRRAALKLGYEGAAVAEGDIMRLRATFPTAIVPVHQGLEQRLWLPDPNDIHVLASAVAGSADVVLTMNRKDFPGQLLAEEGLSRADPDNFILGLWQVQPEIVAGICDKILAEARRLSGQDWTIRALMKKARLPRLGKALS